MNREGNQARPQLWQRPVLVTQVIVAGVIVLLAIRAGRNQRVVLQPPPQNADITSEVISCPTTQPDHWEFGGGANTALNWSNWPNPGGAFENLSYQYQNPNPAAATNASLRER